MAKDAKWYAGWVRLANAQSADEKLTNLETADFIESLAAELEKVKRERDAAVRDIRHDCDTCKHKEACLSNDFCEECGHAESDNTPCCSCHNLCNWEWRGPWAENGGSEDA